LEEAVNNKTQQRMDSSTRAAARATNQALDNDRAVKARWQREDLRILRAFPSVIPTAPAGDLDALIARLVARDGLVAS
jgi:hypothetical protein